EQCRRRRGHRRGRVPRLLAVPPAARGRLRGRQCRRPLDRAGGERRRPARAPWLHRSYGRRVRRHRRRRPGGGCGPPRVPGVPAGVPAAGGADPACGQPGHVRGTRPGSAQGRPVPAGVDVGGVWRPGGAPADRELLGQRQPGRPAQHVRRGQALLRGCDRDVPPRLRRKHRHRAHLQHLRPADGPQRRPRGAQLHQPGTARRADDGVRRRQPDPVAVPRARHRTSAGGHAGLTPPGADQCRQPARGQHAAARHRDRRRRRGRAGRTACRPARRRSTRALPGHHVGWSGARLATRDSPRRRARRDGRVVSHPRHRRL
ncbi:MAG: UDP-glucuronate decarboxylase, partial [uncultured Nocardioidaceae bacterium]